MAPKPRGVALPLLTADRARALQVPLEDVEERLAAVLEEHGCAVVTGVASPEECARLQGLFAEDLADVVDAPAAERAGGAARRAAAAALEDPQQWPEQSMSLLGEMGRCQLRGLPHGRFAWACRLHAGVRRCYEALHGTQDLVSSCDNTFFAPAAQREERTNRSWPHVDQNVHDRRVFDEHGQGIGEWGVFQGLLYIWSAEASHASATALLPGSHLEAYDELMADAGMAKRGRKGSHFSALGALEDSVLAAALSERWLAGAGRVPVPSGALLLWSSRTLHQGWSGGPRLAQPVCWEPIDRRDAAALERKMRLAALGLPSTHWASLGAPHTLVKAEPCRPVPVGAQGLPARASIRLASLRDGVQAADMWRLLGQWGWDERLPGDVRAALEESLAAEVLAAL